MLRIEEKSHNRGLKDNRQNNRKSILSEESLTDRVERLRENLNSKLENGIAS